MNHKTGDIITVTGIFICNIWMIINNILYFDIYICIISITVIGLNLWGLLVLIKRLELRDYYCPENVIGKISKMESFLNLIRVLLCSFVFTIGYLIISKGYFIYFIPMMLSSVLLRDIPYHRSNYIVKSIAHFKNLFTRSAKGKNT